MTSLFDYFKRHSKKSELSHVLLFKFEFFEVATNDTINSLMKEIDDYSLKIKELEPSMSNITAENYNEMTDDDWEVFEELNESFSEREFNTEYLNSLQEMRIVYLFKNLEIVMKGFIQIAYVNSNTREFYKWENMKTFFKSKSIDISILDGYNECVETRKVNNSIKHADDLSEEIKKIKEFREADYFHYTTMDAFYKRVKPKVEIFCEQLKQKVEEDLYSFNEERLNQIAEEHFERMTNDNIKYLISKLKSKIE